MAKACKNALKFDVRGFDNNAIYPNIWTVLIRDHNAGGNPPKAPNIKALDIAQTEPVLVFFFSSSMSAGSN